jgi:hypothetical protein
MTSHVSVPRRSAPMANPLILRRSGRNAFKTERNPRFSGTERGTIFGFFLGKPRRSTRNARRNEGPFRSAFRPFPFLIGKGGTRDGPERSPSESRLSDGGEHRKVAKMDAADGHAVRARNRVTLATIPASANVGTRIRTGSFAEPVLSRNRLPSIGWSHYLRPSLAECGTHQEPHSSICQCPALPWQAPPSFSAR